MIRQLPKQTRLKAASALGSKEDVNAMYALLRGLKDVKRNLQKATEVLRSPAAKQVLKVCPRGTGLPSHIDSLNQSLYGADISIDDVISTAEFIIDDWLGK